MEQEMMGKGQLAALRSAMAAAGADAYVVPMGDFHGSEYIAPYFKTIRFLTCFTGSAGTLAVTRDKAGLWTDGRYFLQAAEQLEGTGIALYRMSMPGVPSVPEFLGEEMPEGGVLGFDGRIVTLAQARAWEEATAGKKVSFRADMDLVSPLWKDRPGMEFCPIRPLLPEVIGETTESKLSRIRRAMEEKGCRLHAVTSLDDIAWILNLRGRDVSCNPVFFSYLLIEEQTARVYLREAMLPPAEKQRLALAGVETAPYEDFFEDLKRVKAESILLDAQKASSLVQASLPAACVPVYGPNPSTLMKAVKNEAEQKALLDSHHRDGIAMVNFLYALSHQVDIPAETEISAAGLLDEERARQGAFSLSFETLSAYGSNGAIVHYTPTEEHCARLEKRGFLLVDSGGQYETGTTDITRTIPLGPLTREEKHAYTAVLRGTLRLQSAVFPAGCDGQDLDILARSALWQEGKDYLHGTGHGVGFVLNVHEGPNAFRWQPRKAPCILEPGMVTTDEPGYYEAGAYGVRIENELLCEKALSNEYGDFLKFRVLTVCPIDTAPVIREEMDASELRELNRYNAWVYEELKDDLEPEVAAWLKEATKEIR